MAVPAPLIDNVTDDRFIDEVASNSQNTFSNYLFSILSSLLVIFCKTEFG